MTIHGHDVYVLNAGGLANVAAFKLSRTGKLTPRFGGRAPLATDNAGASERGEAAE